MGGVHRRDRESRPTSKFNSAELVEQTKKVDEVSFEELAEALDPPTVRFPEGTTPPLEARRTPTDDAPMRARTTTAYDPLTTSLLAEVTRRTKTEELEPLDLAVELGIELPDADPEVEVDIDVEVEDIEILTPPPASPRLIRRSK